MSLKLKKMYKANVDKAMGMVSMIERSMQDLEGAQINSDVYNVLKDGDAMIKELQAKVKIEDLEQIKENTEEAMQLNQEITDFMTAGSLDDSTFLKELDVIENEQVKAELDRPELQIPITKVDKQENPSQEVFNTEEKKLVEA